MKLIKIAAMIVIPLSSINAYSDVYDDCILNGMRGVTNNIAAAAVKSACQSKYQEVKDLRNAQTFGEELTPADNNITLAGIYNNEADGYRSIVITNRGNTKSITYAAIEILDLDSDPSEPKLAVPVKNDRRADLEFAMHSMLHDSWLQTKKHIIYYRLFVPPHGSLKLKFKTNQKDFAVKLVKVMGRESKFLDRFADLATPALPEEKNPLN